MTTTADESTVSDSTADAAVVETPDYETRVNERAEKLHRQLAKKERKKPPAERTPDKQLWRLARQAAKSEVRREIVAGKAKELTGRAARSAAADVSSLLHRNRKQLAPWMLTAPYAAVGEAAALVADYSPGASPAAVAAATGAAGIAASVAAWRKKLAPRVPAAFREKVQAGLGLGCGWAAVMPLTAGPAEWGMWAALLAGTSWLGLSWWREYDHPIPLPGDVATLDVADIPDSTTAGQPVLVRQVIADWSEYVAGRNTLPGSQLTDPESIEHGWAFRLHLVRGQQRIEDVRAALPAIAAALNLDVNTIRVDLAEGSSNQQLLLFKVITETVSNTYDGPVIVREDGDIFIEIGPYEDGLGVERFHVLADQLTAAQLAAGEQPGGSMMGGFALGTKGSGKSRLMEEVAVGFRQLGIEIWFLDPQNGKSSPALMAEADWPLSGLHGAKGSCGNVVDLWRAVKAVCEVREAESANEPGFQHTKDRPAIMVMIDECHSVFQAENPETGQSFGQDFSDLDRLMRKNGIGLFGASQTITVDTFGKGNKATALKDGMTSTNVFLMSYGGKNLNLAPGYDGQPVASLPLRRGLGYNPKGERPYARWQARYTRDFQPWLAAYPRAVLDTRSQKWIGPAYLHRFEQHEANVAANQAWLAALDAAEDASTLPAPGQQDTPRQGEGQRSGGSVVELLSPAQRRAYAAGTTPPTTGSGGGEDASTDGKAALTSAERNVLDVLRDEPHTPTSLGKRLGIASQSAGQHLKKLAGKDWAVRNPDGSYSPQA